MFRTHGTSDQCPAPRHRPTDCGPRFTRTLHVRPPCVTRRGDQVAKIARTAGQRAASPHAPQPVLKREMPEESPTANDPSSKVIDRGESRRSRQSARPSRLGIGQNALKKQRSPRKNVLCQIDIAGCVHAQRSTTRSADAPRGHRIGLASTSTVDLAQRNGSNTVRPANCRPLVKATEHRRATGFKIGIGWNGRCRRSSPFGRNGGSQPAVNMEMPCFRLKHRRAQRPRRALVSGRALVSR